MTVKARAADVPPPGTGVKTVTGTVPAVATSAAATAVVRRVGLTKVVGRSAPFQRTTESGVKRLPAAVSVNAPTPTVVCDGKSALSTGTGLSTVTSEDSAWNTWIRGVTNGGAVRGSVTGSP